MAKVYDYLVELQIGTNPDLENLFNLALKQVFSQTYLSKINTTLRKRLKVKEKINKNDSVVAWVEGTNIYVNKPIFYAKDMKSRIKYLLHEFIHILNNSRSFIILKQFKEINNLSVELWKILKKNSENIGMFLTGKTVPKSLLNKQESLSYLMNDSINWNYITPEGKKLFIDKLKKSQIFNLEHQFWKNRLS